MRFKHLLSEEQLDEIRMSPGALRKFAASPEAEGIRAGFEAELVFTGLGADDDQEWEPDYDADERAYSIQGVVEFFQNDEWGYGMSDRESNRLEERLSEAYYEWYDGQVDSAFREEALDLIKAVWEEEFDREYFVKEYLKNELDLSDDEIDEAEQQFRAAPRFTRSSEQQAYAEQNPGYQRWLEGDEAADTEVEELAEKSYNNQDEYWDTAQENFRDNYQIDDDSGFFSDAGLRWMSDVSNEFNLGWPVMTVTGSAGGFDESNAQNLATDLEEVLGVKTKVSGGYHHATRDDETWIFEPDTSLDSDDSDNMPVEIVSPPMPLAECLDKMEKFFAWAEDNGAYSNSSTGFHMGVSLPHTGGSVDYLKLALFLGDEYVLREFGRSANIYCEAAIKKIRQRVGSKDVSGAMELMRYNLLELAQKQLEINNHGFGKYTSINPQGGVDSTRVEKERPARYIEFRSAGGTNYFEDIEKLQNTLMRYARAMSIAASPAAERREYYTKLYKLLTPSREATGGVELFTEYASGKIDKQELKRRWAESALAKDAPEFTQKGDWVVINNSTGQKVQGQEYNGYTKSEVEQRAKQKLSPASSQTDFDLTYGVVPYNTGRWEIYSFDAADDDKEQTLEIVDATTRGDAADLVYDKYNADGIAFKVRAYYGDYAKNKQPEPKLTPRAQLAKRIKQPNPSKQSTHEIVDRRTNRVVLQYNANSEDDAGNKFNNWLRNQGMPVDTENYGYRQTRQSEPVANIQDVQPDVAQNFSQPQQPQQARATNGVPIWEIYQRDNSHVVHTFADHDQATAWQTARTWLQSIGAEPTAYSDFSVRPKMTANEAIDVISGQGAVAPTTPPKPLAKQPVTPASPAVRVDVSKNKQDDPYAQTYKKIREWEDIVENMIAPVGRLGQ
jgi:hypothetical protein